MIYVRGVWRWITAPVVDGQEGLSLTRVLAIYFSLLAGHVIEHSHTVSLNVLWLSLGAIATAFGKSTFTFLLRRMEFKSSSALAMTETMSHSIVERRDSATGIEPTP